MAHHEEPMDVDSSVCDFDNKENSLHNSNVLSRTPCTEKGYEELDVTELTMKLRYSITPSSSPMSKSYTANCSDNQNQEACDKANTNDNGNLTRSLNLNLTRNDKLIPFQTIPSDQYIDINRNPLMPLDSERVADNILVSVSGPDDNDALLTPSSSSSLAHTPEATTPTTEMKGNESPIVRGLKSVLNMFRPSQSPIPPAVDDNLKPETLSPPVVMSPETGDAKPQVMLASTPLAAHRTKDVLCKGHSPNRESIVFNDDLEKELQWKDETTILFSHEKVPIHKLFFQNSQSDCNATPKNLVSGIEKEENNKMDATLEYMDISYNDSAFQAMPSETQTHLLIANDVSVAAESDSEFVDCETTFVKEESNTFVDVTPLNGGINSHQANVSECSNKTMTTFENSGNKIENTSVIESVVLEQMKPSFDLKNHTVKSADETATTDCKPSVNKVKESNEKESLSINKNMGANELEAELSTGTCISEKNQINNVDKDSSTSVCTEYQDLRNTLNISHDIKESVENDTTIFSSCTVEVCDKESTHVIEESESKLSPVSEIVDYNNETNAAAESIKEIIDVTSESEGKQVPISEAEPKFIKENNVNELSTEVFPLSINKHFYVENNIVNPKNLIDMQNNICASVANSDLDNSVKIEARNCSNPDPPLQSPSPDLGVSNLSKIPLLVDPRVLLFNVNPETVTVEDKCQNVNLESVSPADIPLPDDEDFESITSLPSVVDNNMKDISFNKFTTEHNVLLVGEPTAVDYNVKDITLNKVNSEPNVLLIQEQHMRDVVDNIDKDITLNKATSEHNVLLVDKPSTVDNNVKAITLNKVTSEHKVLLVEEPSVVDYNVKDITFNKVITSEPDVLVETEPSAVDNNVIESIINKENNEPHVLVEEKPSEIDNNVKEFTLNKVNAESNVSAEESSSRHDDIDNLLSDLNIVCKTSKLSDNDFHIKELEQSSNQDLVVESSKILESNFNILNESNGDNTNQPLPDLVQSNITFTQANTENVVSIMSAPLEVNIATPQDKNESQEKTKIIENKEQVSKSLNIEHVIQQDNVSAKNEGFDITKQKEEKLLLSESISTKIPDVDNNVDAVVLNNDEEIVSSKSNSPFVSVSVEDLSDEKPVENLEDIKIEHVESQPFENKSKVVLTPPSSPKIVSKGAYYFNFEEIEDPFAPKTKIRMSPSPANTSNTELFSTDCLNVKQKVPQINTNKNRWKTIQPNRKKIVSPNKEINSTVVGSTTHDNKSLQKSPNISATINSDIMPASNDLEITLATTENSHSKYENKLDISHGDIAHQKSLKSDQVLPLMGSFSQETAEIYAAVISENIINKVSNVPSSTEVNKIESTDESKNMNQDIKDTTIEIVNTIEKYTSSCKPNEKAPQDIEIIDDPKTSSSEQSAFLSPATSSSEGLETKSVFHLPEIDDMNFNPFATKSKMRQSPPLNINLEDTFVENTQNETYFHNTTVLKGNNVTYDLNESTNLNKTLSQDLNETVILNNDLSKQSTAKLDLVKDTAYNLNNTGSSNNTDEKNDTVRTEDEDTIEGPFLEAVDHDVKMSEFNCDNIDAPQFSELPAQVNDDAGELFIDAEAFEFLLNQNANTVADSGKESLFLKFDPLFAKRISTDGAIAALREIQKKQSTPKKNVAPVNETFVAKSPLAETSCDATHDVEVADDSIDELNVTVSKPMMVVSPAVMPVVTPRNRTITPGRLNRQSLTFTSPAIAVIDRLLSMSSNNSLMDLDNTVAEVQREPSEADQALTQLRELLAEKEISVYNLRTEAKELNERLTTLESQMKSLEKINEERLKKINELNEKLNEKTKVNKSMAAVVEEYERTIASLISETEQDRKRHAAERAQLIRDRDEQINHLASMEISFNDLHSKYEKSKQVIFGFKANEEVYKKSLKEFEENCAKMQKNYELLKQHATSKLNHANEELQKINRAHEAEVLKLNAMIKRKELHITSLEETLSQKTKANEELTKICDELLYKV